VSQTEPNGGVGIGRDRTALTNEVAEQELLRLLLSGLTLKEAAGYMRASYWKIRKIARDPGFLVKVKEHSSEISQRMMDELVNSQVEFAKKLEDASEKALEEMISMMDSLAAPSTLKYKIAQDLLDRDARASRTKRIEANTSMSHEFINPAVLIHAAATAKEIERFAPPERKDDDGDSQP